MSRFTWQRSKRFALNGLQYLVGLALLTWVVHTIDLDSVLQATGDLSLRVIVLVVGITVLQVVPVMLYVVVAAYCSPRLRSLFRVDLVVRFVNSVFPSRVSGVSVTPLLLRRHTELDTADATAVTGAMTGLYAICYGLGCVVGLVAFGHLLSAGILTVVLLSTGVYLCIGLVLLAVVWRFSDVLRLGEAVVTLARTIPRLGPHIESAFTAAVTPIRGAESSFRALLSQPGTVGLFVIAFCVSSLALPGLRLWVIVTALGETAPIALFPFYVVVAYNVTVLPLTPGGIGVTEATAVVVLTAIGLSHEVVVSAVLIDRAFGVYLPALVGWYPSLSLDLSR